MEQTRKKVKGQRSYDVSGRQERARRQHTSALDAAQSLFLANGYAATTVESIGHAAGVSAATIYKTYGGKAGLVRDLCQRALAGKGSVPAEERSNALRSTGDARQVIHGWSRLAAEVSPRVSPVLLLLRSAAQSDPEAAGLYDELNRARLARMADNANYLASAGYLRDDMTARDARDILWLHTSPELYDLLINQRGWPRAKFARFISDTLSSQLL